MVAEKDDAGQLIVQTAGYRKGGNDSREDAYATSTGRQTTAWLKMKKTSCATVKITRPGRKWATIMTTEIMSDDDRCAGGVGRRCCQLLQQQDNYYFLDDLESQWLGEGARELGLEGPVDLQTFTDVLHGKLPNGTELGKEVQGAHVHRRGMT